jgi:hypothetical protein
MNLPDIVGWAADVVLDQAAPLHHRDLGDPFAHLDAHHVTPDWTTVAFAPAATLDDLGVGVGAGLLSLLT